MNLKNLGPAFQEAQTMMYTKLSFKHLHESESNQRNTMARQENLCSLVLIESAMLNGQKNPFILYQYMNNRCCIQI